MALTFVLAAVGLALLPSCGGGVDSGGTGAAPVTLAVGPITGFGSVVVGGVHYDESSASVLDGEGKLRSAADLRLGMTTLIDAGPIAAVNGRNEAQASRIRFDVQVLGPVEAIDLVAGSLTVLGQAVTVNRLTVLEAFGQGLASVQAGDVLAVYGQADPAAHRIVATRLEPAAGSAYVLRGSVDSYDAMTDRLVLAGQTLSLVAIEASKRPASLAPGQQLRARLRDAPTAGVWTATALRADSLMLDTRDNVEIEGHVSSFSSAQSFSVDGVPVDASGASFPNGTAGLVAGARVEVEGTSVAGVLIAVKVKVEGEEDEGDGRIELEGKVTSVDATASSFVVQVKSLAYIVTHDNATRFEHGTAADLNVDAKVSVKGTLSSDGTRLLARSIEFH